jgi:hypothetical protein
MKKLLFLLAFLACPQTTTKAVNVGYGSATKTFLGKQPKAFYGKAFLGTIGLIVFCHYAYRIAVFCTKKTYHFFHQNSLWESMQESATTWIQEEKKDWGSYVGNAILAVGAAYVSYLTVCSAKKNILAIHEASKEEENEENED